MLCSLSGVWLSMTEAHSDHLEHSQFLFLMLSAGAQPIIYEYD